jgi:phage-related protein
MADKSLVWLGSSLKDLQDFPALARRLAGFQLRRVQQGARSRRLEADEDGWTRSPGDSDSR